MMSEMNELHGYLVAWAAKVLWCTDGQHVLGSVSAVVLWSCQDVFSVMIQGAIDQTPL